MPLKRSVSKVRHMTGSEWALAELTVDLWVTSHSNSDPSSYPANRRGPEVASVWSRGRMIREKMKTKRKDVNAGWKHCVEVGAEWSRGYHPGSSCWHSRLLWAPFISLLCTLKKIHSGIAHFAPHLYYWPPVSKKKITNVSLLFSTWLIWSYFHTIPHFSSFILILFNIEFLWCKHLHQWH